MRRVTLTAEEIRALCDAVDDPDALDSDDYEAKFAMPPNTARFERRVAAYRSAVTKLRQVNRRTKADD